MTKDGAGIKHRKLRGEWAELRFMARAAENGLRVSKPWGETGRYDFAVEFEAHFVRVQVKSTIRRLGTGYVCAARDCRGNPYEKGALDFLAAYLIPEDVWYIIPAAGICGQRSISLYPKSKRAKYGPYPEAWDLLRGGAPGDRVDSIEACGEGQLAALGYQILVLSLPENLRRVFLRAESLELRASPQA